FQSVHVCGERGGQGGRRPVREPSNGRKPPEAPRIWGEEQEGIGPPASRIDRSQEVLPPTAIGERAHHDDADDVQAILHTECRRAGGGGQTPIDGIWNKMGGQDGGRKATDTVSPAQLPEGPRA